MGGTLKVVSEVPRKEKYVFDLFKKLGFMPFTESPTEESEDEKSYMFRRY